MMGSGAPEIDECRAISTEQKKKKRNNKLKVSDAVRHVRPRIEERATSNTQRNHDKVFAWERWRLQQQSCHPVGYAQPSPAPGFAATCMDRSAVQ